MNSTILKIFILFLFLNHIAVANDYKERSGVIFAAGNLKFVFPQLIKSFYKNYPLATVHIQYGSSGNLASYILNDNRDYDIFFSANTAYPSKVYKAKKSVTKPKIYAQGSLILVTPFNPNLQNNKIAIVKNNIIKNITIANSSSAPYGLAAVEVLKSLHYYEQVKNKIRYSSDVATAIDNVIWRGDVGFLSRSALNMLPNYQNKDKYSWIEIDQKLYHPIIQAYVISKNGLKNKNAMLFLAFLESKMGRTIFTHFGYKNIF
jgi:molybdate transport system substrate-binding protein